MLINFLMKTFLNRIFLIAFFLESLSGFTQNLAIGEWRIEVPYNSAKNLTLGNNQVFASMNVFYAGFFINEGFTAKYETLNGLSDVGVNGVYFDSINDLLFVAYNNGNIDLVKNNTIYNVADIERTSAASNKVINDVFFYDSLAYVATGFGIVVVNLNKREIKETYFIGNNGNQGQVFATTLNGNTFFAATDLGVQIVDFNAPNLANFLIWEKQGALQGMPEAPATDIVSLEGEVIAKVNDSLFLYDGNSWQFFYNDTNFIIENISVSNGHIIISERTEKNGFSSRIKVYNQNEGLRELVPQTSELLFLKDAIMINDSVFFAADFFLGFRRIINGLTQSLNPNSIGTTNITEIAFGERFTWVATGTRNNIFDQSGLHFNENNFWSVFNQFNFPLLENFANLFTLAINPINQHLFVGSFFNGILEFDANGAFVDTFTKNNSTLNDQIGNPRTLVGGIAFDRNNNMWATNFAADRYLSVRKSDGTWRSFKPTNTTSSNEVTKIIIDDFNQKWMINPASRSEGIVVFSEGADIDNTTDDASIALRQGFGSGNLPSNEVLSIAKDADGEIWVGTAAGLVVFFCPGSVLTPSGCDAQEILVTNEDDGFVGALLGTERIQAIVVDGANRKWIGTTSGLWLFSPDGTQQIKRFTTDNSPLLSNNVTSLSIESKTGVLYVGTEIGLQLYRSDATEGNETVECEKLVFPNPVRENYFGPIAVSCLPTNSDVRITDIAGNLVYRSESLGGQIVWDGKDFDGKFAKAGVYLIFAADDEGNNKVVSKLMILR